uniref:Uncharacterized protein n=1 Tax=Tanacetum cinerariifolium TaxID=118510 RepID=A0A699I4Y5_TANCI|nr:hypothetical protein [Tanacetum cinerariifolium]
MMDGLEFTRMPKSTGKSAQAEETVFEAKDTQGPRILEKTLNVGKSVDFRPPQTWISKIAQAEKPPLSFDELMSTPIDFSAYVMNHLKIDNLTQDHLVGPVFNLLKGTCKIRMELEYNIKEYYKVVTDQLDWNNPKGKEYLFNLSKPLPLIMDRGCQVVPVDYFINNNLEYLRRESSSKKYTTSTTKTKVAKFDIPAIEDMVLSVSKHEMYSSKRIIAVTKVKVMKWYDYSYLEEIEGIIYEDKYKRNRLMRTDELYKFSDRTLTSVRSVLNDITLNLRLDYLPKIRWSSLDKKRSRIMIKAIDKLLLERRLMRSLEKFIGIIYEDKYKRNRLMRTDELYKFSDRTLTSVRSVLNDITLNLRLDYLPKIRWSSLDKKRSRIMIKAIDKLLLERRLMRSLEKFIGERDYGDDLRLLQRTI